MSADANSFPSVEPVSVDHACRILRPSKHFYQKPNPAERHAKPPTHPPPPADPPKDKRKLRQGSYESLGLSPPICAALHAAGYNFPTPIQRKVIPSVLAGDDVVAMARTGSGKTAAFLAPLLHRLSESPQSMTAAARRNGPRALVVAPTRELVLQELKFCHLYGKRLQRRIRSAVVVGGTPLEAQFQALAVCPEIVFATPGRLLQIVAEMGAKGGLTLATTETLVFDEADRLFEGTLAVETAALIAQLRDRRTESLDARQTILVSATMPHALAEFSRSGLRKSLSVVRLDVERALSPTMAAAFISVRADVEKDAALQVVLRRSVQCAKSAVVFAATHRRVEYLTELLGGSKGVMGDRVGCVHGAMDQLARQETVRKFRKGALDALVVTDVAARGIDLPELDVVVNYDMPATPKLFVHRVGRVGRAGRFGTAVNLVTTDEMPYMLDIFLFVGRSVVFAEADSCARDEGEGDYGSDAFLMDSSFVLGALPKEALDEEVERTRSMLDDVELGKARTTATNAQKLYAKTRGSASGESVRRAKALMLDGEGGRRLVRVHPWYTDLQSAAERDAMEQVTRLSTWRPREGLVMAPPALVRRKERAAVVEGSDGVGDCSGMDTEMGDKAEEAGASKPWLEAGGLGADFAGNTAGGKISARQAALEEEKKQFFMPACQDAVQRQSEKALKVKSGGKMGDDLNAFRELQDAAMDVNADDNADLLRSKHTGSSSAKYWDRVSKKFVRGGATDKTSKRNLHVASREARARASGGGNYGSEDGALFKKWLSKNKKAVEQLAEQVDKGEGDGGAALRSECGVGSNDYRKGAFGRKARIAAAARMKANGGAGAGDSKSRGTSELKTAEQIKKQRKMKAKEEARRSKKGKKKKAFDYKAPQRGASKSRLIVRGKK